MRILSVVSAGVVVLVLTSVGSSTTGGREQIFTSRYENILGTSLDLKVLSPSRVQAQRAEAAVLHEMDRQSHILSSWSKDSEFSRWSQTHNRPVSVSPTLLEVLSLYDQWRVRTNGALNASAGEVIGVWKQAERVHRLPSKESLFVAAAIASKPQWTLDPAHHTATHTGNASLVLASFTKSYIMDHAADAGLREGVQSIVVNVGGDIVVRGALAEPVDVENPRDDAENAGPLSHLLLHDRAIATSGDYRRGFDIAGHHYSHIVDPRTSMTAENIISSTVVAPHPADAGALATAFSVLKPEESAKLAATMPGVAYLLVQSDGKQIESKGWAALETHPAPAQVASVAQPHTANLTRSVVDSSSWDPNMELTINFELSPIGSTTKRPFMAAWIEDPDHFQVRTLAVWYHEDRWVTEMKAWFRSDRMRAMADGKEIFRSVSSATRPPGKYSLKWDGKDNDGKVVKNGKYNVFLEVVREHGTYQLMKQDMDMTGAPKAVTFPANTEVVASSFDYHRISK